MSIRHIRRMTHSAQVHLVKPKRKNELWSSFSSTDLSADHPSQMLFYVRKASDDFLCSDTEVRILWTESLVFFFFHKKDYHCQPISWLPILTTTVNGNGDMPAASVIGGTTPLPRSDEVYVTRVWIVLIKVVVSVLLKVRSKRNV